MNKAQLVRWLDRVLNRSDDVLDATVVPGRAPHSASGTVVLESGDTLIVEVTIWQPPAVGTPE